jgi:hypothetical protein
MKSLRRLAFLIPLAYGLSVPFLTFPHFFLFLTPSRIQPDLLTENEQRLASAHYAFQPYQRFCYLTPELLTNPEERLHYNLAQYALAPALLIFDPRETLMLLDTPIGETRLKDDPAYQKIADVSPGLSLYQHITQ